MRVAGVEVKDLQKGKENSPPVLVRLSPREEGEEGRRIDPEVILSAGTLSSPHILELSGVGKKAENAIDGRLRVKLPEVGENLQDHLQIRMVYRFFFFFFFFFFYVKFIISLSIYLNAFFFLFSFLLFFFFSHTHTDAQKM